MWRRFGLVLAIAVLPSCGDDPPADVAGAYAVEVDNGDDDCSLDGFAGGSSTLTLTQSETDPAMVSSEFSGGAIQGFLGIALGGSEMSGTIAGGTLTLTRQGAQRQTAMFCEYRVDAVMTATVSADAITGTIRYTGQILDETEDCPFLDNCMSDQTFDGSR